MNYTAKRLARVVDWAGTKYYAVSENTLENMQDSSASTQYIIGQNAEDYQKKQFTVEDLGLILVEQEIPDPVWD
jgi:hypothetical protein